MSGISSNIGLITGIPITQTIEQLLAIEARPRDLIASRNKTLESQQVAVTELTSRLLSVQFHVKKLASTDIFNQQKVTSSNTELLGGRFTKGEPIEGEFQFTPIQQAQSQKALSSTFTSDSKPLGAGSFSFRYEGQVDRGVNLGVLNGGAGVQQGTIRITDRSGESSEIDLRFARTVDDVVRAVNDNSEINVTLLAEGDSFRLVDDSGQSTANLRVQQVGGGTTAQDLGLHTIDGTSSAASISGADVIRLYEGLGLNEVNDRLGVNYLEDADDLVVNFRDGSTPLRINFGATEKPAALSTGTTAGINGSSARLRFTAKETGGDADGVSVRFVDDPNVTAGNEVAEYDAGTRTLLFRIDEGATTADQVIDSLAADPTAGALFTAEKTIGDLFASGTTSPAQGVTAEVLLRAKKAGPEFDGFNVSFVDDANVTAGNETVDYDKQNKTIVFHIDEGATTAFDISAAAATNAQLTADFNVSTPSHQATATTTAAAGLDGQIKFTAGTSGAEFDGVNIVFENDDAITRGSEAVEFIESGGSKTLKIKIDEGATTAADVVAAVNGTGLSVAKFTAALVDGSSGTGVIDVTDTATSAGGGNDGLVDVTDSVTTSGGTSGLVHGDDRAFTSGGAAVTAKTELTLGDIIDTINQQGLGRLSASLSSDGDRLQIRDLTDDLGGEFTIESVFGSEVLADLGLDSAANGDTITGFQLHSGLASTLLRSLAGGKGLVLGEVAVTDRSGNATTIDLSAAATLQDVISTINDQAAQDGVGIQVAINDAHDGLILSDTSAGSGNLTVESGSLDTAEKLGLQVDDLTSSVRGGDLHRQTVTRNTLLSDYNGGAGVAAGVFQIVNSAGVVLKVTIPASDEFTVGDVIDSINGPAFDVEARINETGDGIELVDKAGGEAALRVVQVGFTNTVSDLHLGGQAVEREVDGQTRSVIDGSSNLTVELDDDDTLDDLLTKFNDLQGGAQAVKLGDGSLGNPFRISILGARTGERANLTFDTSAVDFDLNTTSRARDAVIEFGGSSDGSGGGIVVASEDNRFEGVLPGVELEVRGTSQTPVTVAVESTDTNLVATARAFVESFNALRDVIDDLTFFNESDQTTGILFGSSEVLRLESDLSRILTGRFFGVGDIQSLESLGISINGETGKLSFNEEKFQAAFAEDAEAVTDFFTKEDRGAAVKLDRVIETLVGRESSLLVNRARALESKMAINQQRIDFHDARLEAERKRLELQFFRMELAIGKIQNNQTALDSIQFIQPGSVSFGQRG